MCQNKSTSNAPQCPVVFFLYALVDGHYFKIDTHFFVENFALISNVLTFSLMISLSIYDLLGDTDYGSLYPYKTCGALKNIYFQIMRNKEKVTKSKFWKVKWNLNDFFRG